MAEASQPDPQTALTGEENKFQKAIAAWRSNSNYYPVWYCTDFWIQTSISPHSYLT